MRALWPFFALVLVVSCSSSADNAVDAGPAQGPDNGAQDLAEEGGPSEVTLPGHEAQLFGSPHPYCRTFIVGLPNSVAVVVGSDAAATGDHDCTLNREVRYHMDWGDGSDTWTSWIERCDRWVSIEHTYTQPGTFIATVVAEDRQGGRTRSRSYPFVVTATGIDLYVVVNAAAQKDGTVSFKQTVGYYGNQDAVTVEVRYMGETCDGESLLDSSQVSLVPMEEIAEDRVLTLPAGFELTKLHVQVDPDGEVVESCPPMPDGSADRHNNNRVLFIGSCGPPLP